MSDDNQHEQPTKTLSDNWQGGSGGGQINKPLFKPDEMDIYTNKLTYESFIFHLNKVDYAALDHLEYDASDYSMTVVYKDGRRQDLGVKMQWLIRPYIKHAQEISIVRTKDKVAIDGVIVPLVHIQTDA